MNHIHLDSGCPVCSGRLSFGSKLFDDRFGHPGFYSLLCCYECGHRTLDASFNDLQLSELYTNYYPRAILKQQQVLPRNPDRGANAWLNGQKRSAYCWVPRNVRVLDVACGFGEALAYHKLRGCEVYGVETDENVGQVAERLGLQIQIGAFNPELFDSDFFDYVTMDQVVEHFNDPVRILSGVARILRGNGRVVLSTPNPNGWGQDFSEVVGSTGMCHII